MVCGGKKSGTFGHLPSMHVHFLILALPVATAQQCNCSQSAEVYFPLYSITVSFFFFFHHIFVRRKYIHTITG